MSNTEMTLALFGGGGVGKSCCAIRLLNDQFLDYYDPTIEDAFRKQLTVDGEPFMLNLIDTAGQEEFITFVEKWVKKSDGFMLVYSIADRASLDESIPKFVDEIKRVKEKDFPLVIIGNKKDLENERKVTPEEGLSVANEYKCPFFETSAQSGENIEKAFHELIREVRKTKKRIAEQNNENNNGTSKKK